VRGQFEQAWGVTLNPEPGLRIPNMFDAALDGSFKGLYCEGRGHRPVGPEHPARGRRPAAMECIVVQDLFLNETAKYAHVFLPGSSFLEKDGTFTNAERRISRVRKVMPPWPARPTGKSRWPWPKRWAIRCLQSPLGNHGRDRRPDPQLPWRELRQAGETGSMQWPCNEAAPEGTPIMHVGSFVRGKGKFINRYVATDEKVTQRYPLILTTGRILSQYNVGAQTRRTENSQWHSEDRLEIHPHDAEDRGIREGDWVGVESRAGQTVLRATVTEKVQPGWSTPPSTSRNRAPTSSPPTTPTGPPTAPSTR
jgi:formate dehydrogenase major subunit